MASDHDDRATLNAFDIGCIAVGGIIGVGIFFTPSKVAQRCDDAGQVVLAWCLGGVVALLGGLVFAELSCRVRGHGGTFVYLHRALGPLPAFLYGWTNWLMVQSGALGVIGLILVDNLDALLHPGWSTSPHAKIALAVVAILAFTGVNLMGLRFGKRVQNALTITKTLAVFAIVLLAAFTGGGEPTRAFGTERKGLLKALASAMLPVMFAFGGWQQASFVAGAARRPRFDVPVGILGGVAVVVLAYVTVNLAYLELLGFGGVSQTKQLGVDAARAALSGTAWGDLAGRLLAAAIVVSSCGILNTICLAPPYVLHTMANEGLFPEVVGRLHATTRAPTVAVLVQGTWGALLLIGTHSWVSLHGDPSTLDVLDYLLDGVVFADWLFFALVGVALWLMRDEPHPGGFRLPGRGILGLVFAAAGLAIMAGAVSEKWGATKIGLVICAAGVPAYFLMRTRQRPG